MTKLVDKIINLNYFLFPLLWGIVLCLSLVEVFSYTGFVAKHIFLSLDFFLVLVLWSGLLLKFTFTEERRNFLFRLIRIINKPLFFLLSILMMFSLILEASRYSNYVYSTYHLTPENIFWPWFLSLFLLLMVISDRYLKFDFPAKLSFKKSFIFALLIWIFAVNIFTIHERIFENLYFMLTHPLISFEDKMRDKAGKGFYDYTLFVKKNTPENAVILIPPQGYPWPQTGNSGYLRYFLYPRQLISGKEYEPRADLNKEKVDFVLLAFGENPETQYGFTHGWPKFNVKAKRVIYWTDGSEKIVPGDFIYNKNDSGEPQWGLIEVEKQ